MGYPAYVGPLLDAIVQLRDGQMDLMQRLENGNGNGSSSSPTLHTAANDENVPPPPPIRLPRGSPEAGPETPTMGRRSGTITTTAHTPAPSIRPPASPVASRAPFATADGRWELGSDMQAAMVKSAASMVTRLPDTATYAKFKAWLSAVEDWVASHLGTPPDALGPHAVRTTARLSMTAELYALLETTGVLGA